MSGWESALAAAAMFVGATIQGSIGFGMNIVAAPVLVLIDTTLVPGPALCAALVLTLLVGWRDRHAIDARGFGWVIAGRVPASVGAAFVVAALPEAGVAIALAAVVLIAVALSSFGLRFGRDRATLLVAGFFSGLTGTIASIGAPPVAIVYQDSRGAELRGTMSAILLAGGIASCLSLAVAGRFGGEQIRASLILIPSTLAGFFISRWTHGLFDRRSTRPAVLVFSALSSIAAIVRYAI